jgi:hypothetical protein
LLEARGLLKGTWPRWVPGVSANHWSNLAEKKKLVTTMAEFVADYHLERKTPKDEIKECQWVCVLDCWRVNICKDFLEWVKREHPGCRLRYIPAGTTGIAQINDVYLHGPFKKWVKMEADLYYQQNLVSLQQKVHNKEMTNAQMTDALHRCLSLPTLRTLTVDWNTSALNRLVKKDRESLNSTTETNLIERGWLHIFPGIYSPKFRDAAAGELGKLNEEEAKKELEEKEAKTALHAEPAAPKGNCKKMKKQKTKATAAPQGSNSIRFFVRILCMCPSVFHRFFVFILLLCLVCDRSRACRRHRGASRNR